MEAASIYCITNKVNGKQYIGVSKDPKKRFRQHCNHKIKTKAIIKNAILLHGKENFELQILLHGPKDYCYELEPKLIEAYNTRTPDGYNICKGGQGAVGLCGEFNGMYGRKGELHPHYGKPGYRTGIKHTEETKRKMSKAHKGRVFSEETRKKISENAKKRTDHMEHMRECARKARELRKE